MALLTLAGVLLRLVTILVLPEGVLLLALDLATGARLPRRRSSALIRAMSRAEW